jgi:hypothetical protein
VHHYFQALFSGSSWTPDSFIENYVAKMKSYPLDFSDALFRRIILFLFFSGLCKNILNSFLTVSNQIECISAYRMKWLRGQSKR